MDIHAIPDIPLIAPGDDLAAIIIDALECSTLELSDGDILVIAQKVLSKSENRYVDLATVTPSSRARELAAKVDKDPRLVELILSESSEVLRAVPGVLVVVHRLGHVMANAGIDQSNLGLDENGRERVLLLPENPDAASARLRSLFENHFQRRIGVIINDSVGRAWRNGSVGMALGVAGPPALWDRIGTDDLFGRPLQITQIGWADQIAAAAALVMGEGAEGQPVVKIGGLPWEAVTTNADSLLRPKEQDLFR